MKSELHQRMSSNQDEINQLKDSINFIQNERDKLHSQLATDDDLKEELFNKITNAEE